MSLYTPLGARLSAVAGVLLDTHASGREFCSLQTASSLALIMCDKKALNNVVLSNLVCRFLGRIHARRSSTFIMS